MHKTLAKGARTLVECLELRAKASVESTEEHQDMNHQISDDNFIHKSSDTRQYGISDEEKFQEECIIPDRQNLADGIQELCSGDQIHTKVRSEILLENIFQEF